MLEYINIEKENIPYRFEIEIEAEVFEIEVRYNENHDFFTIDLYDSDENALVYGEKVVYGVPLFDDVQDSRFPVVLIVPKDEAGLENVVNYDSFNQTVFLVVER